MKTKYIHTYTVVVKKVVVFNNIIISITWQLICNDSRGVLIARILRGVGYLSGVCENVETLLGRFKMENDITASIL